MQADRDLELLTEAAREAGDLASSYFQGEIKVWDKPGGAGPVSEADLAVDTLLRESLTKARPDYGWLSEETEDSDARFAQDKVFVVDPIDGTRSFLGGSSTWAHSLAVVEKGQVTSAVVYLPMRGKLYAAALGSGAKLNGGTIATGRAQDVSGSNVLAARPAMDGTHWPNGAPDVKRAHRPSLAYRLCLVAEGRFDAMFTFRKTWEWDIAAGTLILSEAGATVSDRLGDALRFNNPHPQTEGVVAAGPELHSGLMEALGRE